MKNILLILTDHVVDPLGAMYLMGNVNANFDVAFIIDQHDNKLNDFDYKKYDIVGFTTMTGGHIKHNEIAKIIKNKNPKIITIMGGPHPTFFPKEALELSHIDYICIGEGTIALQKFINEEKTNNIINDYNNFTGILDPIQDLDKMKINREIVYKIEDRGNHPIKNFMGTFSCPYNCTYCYNYAYREMYKHQHIKAVRCMNPKILIEDIKNCVTNYSTKFIYFQDDTFIINKKWFVEVTNLIKKEINLPYHCHIRPDITTEEIIKQLKTTGCKSVSFAIEDSSEEYREKYLNRKMSNEKIIKVANLLHKYNIDFRIFNILALPFNTLKDNLNTLELNYKCHPLIALSSLFQPYLNTVLGNITKNAGLWSGDIDDIAGYMHPKLIDKSPLKIEDKIKVERLQKLFSLGVSNYFIKKLIPILINLPLDDFYAKLHIKFKIKQYNKLYSFEN
jgi:anaerobic magnesium-protoporphyrin IX monomethyl ester cyclase